MEKKREEASRPQLLNHVTEPPPRRHRAAGAGAEGTPTASCPHSVGSEGH